MWLLIACRAQKLEINVLKFVILAGFLPFFLGCHQKSTFFSPSSRIKYFCKYGMLVFNSRYFQNAGIHKVEGVQIHRKFLGAQEGQSVSQSLTHTFRFPLCRCLCMFTTQRSRDVIFFECYYQQVSDFDCDVYFPKCFLF